MNGAPSRDEIFQLDSEYDRFENISKYLLSDEMVFYKKFLDFCQ